MLNCIVTGLGGRGLHWVRAVCGRKDCGITGYVEPAEANRRRAVEQHDVPEDRIFNTLDEALEKAQADFVLDVTPPAVHHEIAAKAFERGLHVLGEKPLSDDFGNAKATVELGNRLGRKHMITQNYRFTACPRTTRKKLAEGMIGKPGQCDLRFYMPWADMAGSHYVTQPYMLINDMMVHHFDMMRYVLGVDPVAVQAITWNHPWGWHAGDAAHAIVFEFPEGLHGTHVSVGCALGSQTSWNGDWRIEGTEGSIDWEKDRMWFARLHRTPERTRKEIFPVATPPAEQAILDEFFAAIRDDREPECSAQDNLKSLAMVFGAIRSAKEKRRVELSELG
jgi:predicted dehydrogenase